MAAINLAFDSFEDMVEFAGKLVVGKPTVTGGKVVGESIAKGIIAPAQNKDSGRFMNIPDGIDEEVEIPQEAAVQQPAVSTNVAYGQQIAQNFPQANTVAVQQPVMQQPVLQRQPVQTNTQTYTLDDLAGAAMVLMDKGMQTQLQQLLAGYGVESLPALPQEQYGNFATALRGLGAQI